MQLAPFNGVPSVDPELLLQEQRSGREPTILDIRDDDDFRSVGFIAGARHIALRQLLGRRAELAGLESAPVVVVSGHGVRAHAAAVALKLAGFTEVRTLAGGMARWLELGLPTARPRLPA